MKFLLRYTRHLTDLVHDLTIPSIEDCSSPFWGAEDPVDGIVGEGGFSFCETFLHSVVC